MSWDVCCSLGITLIALCITHSGTIYRESTLLQCLVSQAFLWSLGGSFRPHNPSLLHACVIMWMTPTSLKQQSGPLVQQLQLPLSSWVIEHNERNPQGTTSWVTLSKQLPWMHSVLKGILNELIFLYPRACDEWGLASSYDSFRASFLLSW
jgi:hypothetical protein